MRDAWRRHLVGAGLGVGMGLVLGAGEVGFIWLAMHGGRTAVGLVLAMSCALTPFAPTASPGVPWSLDAEALQDPTRRLQLELLLSQVAFAVFALSWARLRTGDLADWGLALALTACCLLLSYHIQWGAAEGAPRPPKLLSALGVLALLAGFAFWMVPPGS